MLTELFVVGTLWFWLLLGVVTCVLFALIENERFGWATFTLAVALALLHLFGNVNVIAFVRQQPLEFALCVLGYFFIGTVWGVVKWWFFVQKRRREYDEKKADFLARHQVAGTAIPPELKDEWFEACGGSVRNEAYCDKCEREGGRGRCDHDSGRYKRVRQGTLDLAPKARDHKGQILGWMTYWPWSLAWTLLDDPVKRAFKWIFHQIQGLLQQIADSAFKGTDGDWQ